MNKQQMPRVAPLWCDPSLLTHDDIMEVYSTCERGAPGKCVNTKFVKKAAEIVGREVRKVSTLKGYQNWSECVNGSWHMFRQPLRLTYAKKIDNFDLTGQRFRLPKNCPMGPVEYKGVCAQRDDGPEARKERKERLNARIKSGALVPRAKFRAPQAPAVMGMTA